MNKETQELLEQLENDIELKRALFIFDTFDEYYKDKIIEDN